MAACLIPRFPECCATAALSSPAAQQLSRRAVDVLDALRFSLLLPGTLPRQLSDAACTLMLTWTHLAFGLVLPAMVAAGAEAALFQRHQRQRLRAGLQPEGGWEAKLYGSLWGLRELDWILWVTAGWMLAGVVFDAALLASGAV